MISSIKPNSFARVELMNSPSNISEMSPIDVLSLAANRATRRECVKFPKSGTFSISVGTPSSITTNFSFFGGMKRNKQSAVQMRLPSPAVANTAAADWQKPVAFVSRLFSSISSSIASV